jgi:hypothetical protein
VNLKCWGAYLGGEKATRESRGNQVFVENGVRRRLKAGLRAVLAGHVIVIARKQVER